MLDANQFLSIYPQFATVEQHLINYHLKFAAENYCSSWSEPKKTNAIMLITAHILSMDWIQQTEIAGNATNIASGGSVSNTSEKKSDWNLTTYGRQYLSLAETIFSPPIMIL